MKYKRKFQYAKVMLLSKPCKKVVTGRMNDVLGKRYKAKDAASHGETKNKY